MIAISFDTDGARLLRAEWENDRFVVTQWAGVQLPAGILTADPRSEDFADGLTEILGTLAAGLRATDGEIGLSVGRPWAQSSLEEVDHSLPQEEKEEYFAWMFQRKLGLLWEETEVFLQEFPGGGEGHEKVYCSWILGRAVTAFGQAAGKALGSSLTILEPADQSLLRVAHSLGDASGRIVVVEPERSHYRFLVSRKGRACCQGIARVSGKMRKLTVIQGNDGRMDFPRFLEREGDANSANSGGTTLLLASGNKSHLHAWSDLQLQSGTITAEPMDPFSKFPFRGTAPESLEERVGFVKAWGVLFARSQVPDLNLLNEPGFQAPRPSRPKPPPPVESALVEQAAPQPPPPAEKRVVVSLEKIATAVIAVAVLGGVVGYFYARQRVPARVEELSAEEVTAGFAAPIRNPRWHGSSEGAVEEPDTVPAREGPPEDAR